MSCDRCTCGGGGGAALRVCDGCGEPITGRHGFTSFKADGAYSTLHAACSLPDDAA